MSYRTTCAWPKNTGRSPQRAQTGTVSPGTVKDCHRSATAARNAGAPDIARAATKTSATARSAPLSASSSTAFSDARSTVATSPVWQLTAHPIPLGRLENGHNIAAGAAVWSEATARSSQAYAFLCYRLAWRAEFRGWTEARRGDPFRCRRG